jgi:hypothetical protein
MQDSSPPKNCENTLPPPRWLIRLVWAAVAFALLRNLLPPNLFTATVLIFDYDFGLVRRGFWGSVLNLYWGDTVSKTEVYVACFALTLVGIAALLAVFFRWFGNTMAGAKLLLLLVSSFAFSAIIASTGYIDLVLIGLVSMCLFSNPARPAGIAVRCFAVALGIVMHESMLAYFSIYLVYDIWCSQPKKHWVLPALTPLLVGVIAFGAIMVWGQLPASTVPDYIAHIEAKSEFTAEPDATAVMEHTIVDNLAMMTEKRRTPEYQNLLLFDGVPLLILSIWLLVLNLRLLPQQSLPATKLLLFFAMAAPVSLNIIAFDVVRFGAISALIGFMALLTLVRADPHAMGRIGATLSWPVIVVFLVVNLNVTVNQINTGDGHLYGVPWVLVKQLDWVR